MAAEEMKERLVDVPGIGDCFIGTIHSFANRIFKNSNETYRLYTDEIQDQFMTVLTNLYAKHLTMDKYFIYKDTKKKVDLGLLEEYELEARLTQAELYEIAVFMGEIENKDYKENIKTFMGSCVSWGVGYAGMWSSKWILASLFTKENIIADAITSVLHRVGVTESNESVSAVQVILKNIGWKAEELRL